MTFTQLIQGLTILAKYTPKGLNTNFIGTMYGTTYVTDEAEIDTEDKQTLKDLGFEWNTTGCYIPNQED